MTEPITAESAAPLDLSVVIPVLNGARVIATQLRALSEQEWHGRWEVIVVDNGSTDDTRAVALSFASTLPDLRVIDASDRRGASYAMNYGIATARGEAVLLLDADDMVAPGYVAAMAAALATSPFVAASYDNEALNEPWAQASRPDTQRDSLGDAFGFLPIAGGGGLGVRKEVLDEQGGFDASLATGEDIDFCWRLQLAGVPLRFAPDAVVRVRYRTDLRGIFRQAKGYGGAGPSLYRRYRSLGMPRRSWRTAIRFWLGVVPRLLAMRSKGDLAHCVFLLGVRIGLLQGCVRERVRYL